MEVKPEVPKEWEVLHRSSERSEDSPEVVIFQFRGLPLPYTEQPLLEGRFLFQSYSSSALGKAQRKKVHFS